MNYTIEIERNPKSDTIKQIRNGLIVHNVEQSDIKTSQNIAIKALSDEGQLLGGMIAWQWGGCMEIEYLWIDNSSRGAGVGTQLIKQLETLLSGHSHKTITTNTFSFQAPEFYLKNGFLITDEVSGYPDNVKKFYLKKTL